MWVDQCWLIFNFANPGSTHPFPLGVIAANESLPLVFAHQPTRFDKKGLAQHQFVGHVT
jgi:hypothetical protein